MTPDASRWRSQEAYEHVEALSASDLAWEWLRRNEAYDEDYSAIARAEPQSGVPSLTEAIQQRWGIRFPGRSPDRAAGRTSHLDARGGHEHRRSCPRAGGPGIRG